MISFLFPNSFIPVFIFPLQWYFPASLFRSYSSCVLIPIPVIIFRCSYQLFWNPFMPDFLASYPGPAQLSVTCYHTGSDGKLGGAWERGYGFLFLLCVVGFKVQTTLVWLALLWQKAQKTEAIFVHASANFEPMKASANFISYFSLTVDCSQLVFTVWRSVDIVSLVAGLALIATRLQECPPWIMMFFTERVRNKSTEKKSGIQLGFEPKTYWILLRCSYH